MTATVSAPTGFEPLDPAIREQYDRDGFVVIPNALPEADRAYFEDAVDRIYGEEEAAGELRPDRFNRKINRMLKKMWIGDHQLPVVEESLRDP